MRKNITILIVDDEHSVRDSLYNWFVTDGYSVDCAENAVEALKKIEQKHYQIILIDIKMPGMDGLELHRRIKSMQNEAIVIIMTAFASVDSAVEALKDGAYDYICKPFDPDQLSQIIRTASQAVEEKTAAGQPKESLAQLENVDNIIGSSPAMLEVFDQIKVLSQTDSTVIISGDSGTGKELIAHAIHVNSHRRYFPMIIVHSGALTETLLESELFGHERGAFTGAVRRQDGKFQQAGSGTIFLDEIGDMPFNLQLKLLRVLEEREFSPIGNSQAFPVKARFITATNQDLKALMDAGRFREDLYYRLHVYGIHVPPLRERKDDLPELIQFFIDQQSRLLDQLVQTIAPEALAHLQDYDFPGNVRELRNLIISAMTQEKGPVLTWQSFPASLKASLAGVSPVAASPPNLQTARNAAIRRFEHEYLQQILKQTHGNVTAAARLAGIARQSLQRLMQRHGFRSRDFKTEL